MIIGALILLVTVLTVWTYYKLEILIVSGNSMLPTIKPKRPIIMTKRLKMPMLQEGCVYVYKSPTGQIAVKRLIRKQPVGINTYLWFEGDNSSDSIDSRAYGFLSMDVLEGRVLFIKQRK